MFLINHTIPASPTGCLGGVRQILHCRVTRIFARSAARWTAPISRIEVLRYIKTTIPELWGWNSFLPSYSDLWKSAWKEFYRSILIKYFALPARRFLC